MTSAPVTTTDPRTGTTQVTELRTSTPDVVRETVKKAADGFAAVRDMSRDQRAALLEACADELESRRQPIVETAMSETGLPVARLEGELTRSSNQFRLFAEVVRDGGYLEAAIDHGSPSATGPLPELRRMLVPIGPVAVFGASNFPLAFSVPGGDTASAIAAGCSVVVKAHAAHPLTSRITVDALRAAARAQGVPEEVFGIVHGRDAGRRLVADPQMAAVGFTGSLSAAQALMEIIQQRDEPIPFYGELSSLNPVIVTPQAARQRGEEIAEGLFASFVGSAGQLCTKPGVAFVPREAHRLVAKLTELTAAADPQHMLTEGIASGFGAARDRIDSVPGTQLLAQGGSSSEGFSMGPTLLWIDAAALRPESTEEAFGPLLLLAGYDMAEEVIEALRSVPKSLTLTLHSEPSEAALRRRYSSAALERAGRLVYDGFPTGVRVSWAQHHGGPWPATNTVHTSVGASAIRRFLRPMAWQDAPVDVLPVELTDDYSEIPRRVDGRLRLPSGPGD